MGASTSKEEKEAGTAVTALNYKIEMPGFARAEQLPRGWFLGNAWAKKQTPPGIIDFLTSKKCLETYNEFKTAVCKASGGSFLGWSSPKILEVSTLQHAVSCLLCALHTIADQLCRCRVVVPRD